MCRGERTIMLFVYLMCVFGFRVKGSVTVNGDGLVAVTVMFSSLNAHTHSVHK